MSSGSTPLPSLAFIGLGVMGGPMAGHLAQKGYKVTVYNRSAAKTQAWLDRHAALKVSASSSPARAAEGAEIIFCCVGNDDDLRAVTLGADGAFQAMGPGSVFIDHTTASADTARELGRTACEKGFYFLDAPVSGGESGAINASLTVMVGGDEYAFDRVRPYGLAFSKAFTRVGENGTGQLAKMVNQICVAGVVQGLAEGLKFGMRSGLDMKLVLDIISKGAAQSWQMENRGTTMIADQFDFGFAVDWMRKDLGLCLQEASRNGASLPITALIDQFYADLQRMGGQRWDTSSLIKRL